MKKKKFLMTILIASSVFLGTGYAWWADGLEIEGMVSTGEFKVVGIPSQSPEYAQNASEHEGLKSLSYDMSDLFPGRIYEFGAEFKNVGSIPAVVEEINIIMKEALKDDTAEKITTKGSVRIVGGSNELEPITIDTTIKELETELATEFGSFNDWKLEPGESLVFEKWKVALPKAKYNESSKENEYEGKNVSFDLEIVFKQHNQQ